MKQWRNLSGLVAIVSLLFLFNGARAAETLSPLPQITEGVLDNGLRYTLVPLSGQKQRVDVRLSVDVGSIDEQDNESGVAHMLEHLVFRASEQYPQGVATQLHQRGWVRAQHYNAMTNYERTLYMFSPPGGAGQLDVALESLSQMAGHARLTQRDLDDERRIILEEWRGKLGVAERMNQQRVQAIRHGSRYPERPTIGTEASIRNTPATTLQQFYQRWYHPGNMRLLVIGDFRPETAAAEIKRYFGTLPAGAVPERDYYEPRLQTQLKVVRLQDGQSGSSQLSLVLRSNPGTTTYEQRLISQIALSSVSRQMRRQKPELPAEVGGLVVRKSDIGKTTEAFGVFADVMPDGHQVALRVLLREVERVRRYGLSDVDIADVKQDIREVAQRMAAKPEQREFADWVQQIFTSWAQGKPYTGSQQRGREALAALDTITNQQVNARLQQWLTAGDALVQFSIPGNTPFTLPTAQSVIRLREQLKTETLAPPQRKVEQVVTELKVTPQPGTIAAVKSFPQQQVEQWTLSNGDRVVLLRTPLAKDKVWLSGRSAAGFNTAGLNPWQSQLATQLVGQSGPQGWQGEQLVAWKQQKAVSSGVSQLPDELQYTGQSSREALGDLLALNYALQTAAGIDPDVMKESLLRLARQQAVDAGSAGNARAQATRLLRYGSAGWTPPTQQQLKTIDAGTLLTQWQTAARAPVSWFILADMSPELLKPLAERYLAGIPRQPVATVQPELPRSGRYEETLALNVEPRADVKSWSFTPQTWTPQAAVQVSIARNLASQALKSSLRDDALGIYRMQMNSELADRHQRIETEVSFTSAPERAQELWQRAEAVFAQLPQQITQQQIDVQKRDFIRAEQGRQQDIYTLQRRLELSYRHYNDPRYLSDAARLADSITLAGVQAMAARLYNPQNRVVSISLPQQVKK
ncbi:insulinase family protein [Erwinia sp. E602]|uniref:M16 family metallopeptidase n=1 Tax=Erwinia sp. E602 TaxID=2675378 RepID=UPI001BAE4FCB|nr:pitrilysin family protein [Erwinia sp. E602]QUG74604.1 insulinase family protein [Erwinia sp. E602]